MSPKTRRAPPPTGVVSVPTPTDAPDAPPAPLGRIPVGQAPPTLFVQRPAFSGAEALPDVEAAPELEPGEVGRPETNFVRVDRFTEEEKRQIHAPAPPTARSKAPPAPVQATAQAPAQPPREKTGTSKLLIALVVLAVLGLVGGLIVALLLVGAWLAVAL